MKSVFFGGGEGVEEVKLVANEKLMIIYLLQRIQ